MKLQDIYESKKSVSAGLSLKKVVSYISSKLGVQLLRIPGAEHFRNSTESGYGIRYVENGSTRCIRLNWNTASGAKSGKISTLHSIDFFNGKNHDPTYSIVTKGISVVQALPMVVSILQDPEAGKYYAFPVSADNALAEDVLLEVARNTFTGEKALSDFLHRLSKGDTFTRGEFMQSYHIDNVGIFDTMVDHFADRLIFKGKRISLASNHNVDKLKDSMLARAGIINVVPGGTKEEYFKSEQEEALEKDAGEERVPYADTLEHLEGLVEALIKGSANALFVAGKGGSLFGSTRINIIFNENGKGHDSDKTENEIAESTQHN